MFDELDVDLNLRGSVENSSLISKFSLIIGLGDFYYVILVITFFT
jgi:hypothetical protein